MRCQPNSVMETVELVVQQLLHLRGCEHDIFLIIVAPAKISTVLNLNQ